MAPAAEPRAQAQAQAATAAAAAAVAATAAAVQPRRPAAAASCARTFAFVPPSYALYEQRRATVPQAAGETGQPRNCRRACVEVRSARLGEHNSAVATTSVVRAKFSYTLMAAQWKDHKYGRLNSHLTTTRAELVCGGTVRRAQFVCGPREASLLLSAEFGGRLAAARRTRASYKPRVLQTRRRRETTTSVASVLLCSRCVCVLAKQQIESVARQVLPAKFHHKQQTVNALTPGFGMSTASVKCGG